MVSKVLSIIYIPKDNFLPIFDNLLFTIIVSGCKCDIYDLTMSDFFIKFLSKTNYFMQLCETSK